MRKSCQCGAFQSDSDPIYCKLCRTFTHPVYVKVEEKYDLNPTQKAP